MIREGSQKWLIRIAPEPKGRFGLNVFTLRYACAENGKVRISEQIMPSSPTFPHCPLNFRASKTGLVIIAPHFTLFTNASCMFDLLSDSRLLSLLSDHASMQRDSHKTSPDSTYDC